MGKGEIARYEQFLLFPQCFQKACFPGASKGVIVCEWVNNRVEEGCRKRKKHHCWKRRKCWFTTRIFSFFRNVFCSIYGQIFHWRYLKPFDCKCINPLLNNPWFSRPRERELLKTLIIIMIMYIYIALYPGQPGLQRCTISYKYSHTNLHKHSH